MAITFLFSAMTPNTKEITPSAAMNKDMLLMDPAIFKPPVSALPATRSKINQINTEDAQNKSSRRIHTQLTATNSQILPFFSPSTPLSSQYKTPLSPRIKSKILTNPMPKSLNKARTRPFQIRKQKKTTTGLSFPWRIRIQEINNKQKTNPEKLKSHRTKTKAKEIEKNDGYRLGCGGERIVQRLDEEVKQSTHNKVFALCAGGWIKSVTEEVGKGWPRSEPNCGWGGLESLWDSHVIYLFCNEF